MISAHHPGRPARARLSFCQLGLQSWRRSLT